MVAAANADPTAANLAALRQAVGPVVFAKAIANVTELKTLVVPYQTQLTYLSGHQASLTSLVKRRGPVAQAVAALVLGLRRRDGPVHPDHLAQPGTVEPEQGPEGRDRARPKRWSTNCTSWWVPAPDRRGSGTRGSASAARAVRSPE